MDLVEYFQHLYDYNVWANHRSLLAARGLTREQFFRQLGHSWGSVHGVLLHIMNSEWIWLSRWKGHSPDAFPPANEFPTLEALQERWEALETEMQEFLVSQTPDSLELQIQYRTTRGSPRSQVLWQMMAHVPNHGTHHRGELAAMFATLDVEHEEEDFLHYFLEKQG